MKAVFVECIHHPSLEISKNSYKTSLIPTFKVWRQCYLGEQRNRNFFRSCPLVQKNRPLPKCHTTLYNTRSCDLCKKHEAKETDAMDFPSNVLVWCYNNPSDLFPACTQWWWQSYLSAVTSALRWFTHTTKRGRDKYLSTKNRKNCKHHHLHHTWNLLSTVLVQNCMQSA